MLILVFNTYHVSHAGTNIKISINPALRLNCWSVPSGGSSRRIRRQLAEPGPGVRYLGAEIAWWRQGTAVEALSLFFSNINFITLTEPASPLEEGSNSGSQASAPTKASSMRPVPRCARSCIFFTTDPSFGPLRL